MTDADTALPPPDRLDRPDGGYIAYRRHVGKAESLPGVVFIHGLRSDMDGGKAERRMHSAPSMTKASCASIAGAMASLRAYSKKRC